MPSATAHLEEGEMTTERRGQANGMRVLLEFLVGNSLLHSDLRTVNNQFSTIGPQPVTHRIVCGLNRKVWYANRKHRVARGSVAVVG